MQPLSSLLTDLNTPALLLDTARLDANLDRLKAHLSAHGVALRPHLKTAKSIDVARRAMTSPQGPATVSTLAEAEYFAAHGVTDILYAVGIAPGKLARVIALRRLGVDLTIVADSVEAARAVGLAAREADMSLPVLIEVDCDGHRTGVRDGDFEHLAAIADALLDGGCEVRGIMTHAGSSYDAASHAEMTAIAAQECGAAVRAAQALRARGIACPVVSVGSTPTALYGEDFAQVTEVRAGVFMFFDLVMAGIAVCRPEDIALSVLATVISRQDERGRLVIDAGWTALSRDRGTAGQAVDQGFGLVAALDGTILPDLIVTQTNQEHGVIEVRPGSQGVLPPLNLGDRVRILPNHACATAGQHSGYWLVEGASPQAYGYWPRFGGW